MLHAQTIKRALRGAFIGDGQPQEILAFTIASYGGVGVAGSVTALLYLEAGLWGGGLGEVALFAASFAGVTAFLARVIRNGLNAG